MLLATLWKLCFHVIAVMLGLIPALIVMSFMQLED